MTANKCREKKREEKKKQTNKRINGSFLNAIEQNCKSKRERNFECAFRKDIFTQLLYMKFEENEKENRI